MRSFSIICLNVKRTKVICAAEDKGKGYNTGKMWSNRAPCSLLQEMQNGMVPLENSLMEFYVHTKTCTWKFILASFIVSNLGSAQDIFQ